MPQDTQSRSRPGALPAAPKGDARTRQAWIDGLRLMAGLSMLGLHATADRHGLPFPSATAEDRLWPMILRTLFYSARTELFVMLSIFLLTLSLKLRPRGYSQTIRQQAQRLLPPFLFWTAFYSLFSLLKAGHMGYLGAAFTTLGAPETWLSYLLLGTAKYHLHFIPTLLGLLLFYPLFLAAYTRPWMVLGACLAVWMKWSLERWAYPVFWGNDALPYIIRAIKILSYLGYGLAAAAIAGLWMRHGPSLRRSIPWAVTLTLLLCGALLLNFKAQTIAKVIATGRWVFDDPVGYWADFLMPVVLLLLAMVLTSAKWPKQLPKWAPYSLGIYLCHPIFLDIAEVLLPEDIAPILQVIFKIAFALPLTLGLVQLLKRTKALAWTIGLGPPPQIAFLTPFTSKTPAPQKEETSC
ncbi:acyltransferase [Thalassobius sp. Cn5-15]|uniref:acyltransferase family protein n=1 Tax=Thalassobius sp. Cn5-15 TaxID=2917763 RepID=UPI001EF27898|nr:acyltransferase [Thalassobius sp. Cn5-15]MCG7494631.1 acyltransferase [Thalassobius sp. Cn5-15]